MNENLSLSDQFLSVVNQIIEENLGNENFSVEDLAKKIGLSRSMLHRKLIKLTGKSASDLIIENRLLRAKELLEKDVATVSEIAYKVGFNSPSYFNKVFKNYFQVTPGEVRKNKVTIHHEAAIEENQEIKNVSRGKIRSLSLIVLAALLIFVVTGTGIYYFSGRGKLVEKSFAILPFDNLSSDNENQFIADGIVEDLLNRISKIEGLKVISRTSSEMFRDKGNKSVSEIAHILGVRYILEGTVQRETNNVRISIQLIDAKKDDHILSQQYDRDLKEIFKIQSEIASQIASELSFALTYKQEDILKQDQTVSLKALEYKQLGRYYLNKRTNKDLFTSVNYFRRAIAEDPDYALAYAELADSYFILSWYRYIEKQTGRDSAVYLANKALELDKNLGEAHTVLGVVYNEYDWKYDAAEKEFLKAIELKPNHAPAYQYYSELLSAGGKLLEARNLLNKAIQLDPLSFILRYASSLLYFKEEKFNQALEENRLCQELVKDHIIALGMAFQINMKIGNEQTAIEYFKKMVKITDNWTPEEVDSIYRIGGMEGLLRWRLNEGAFKRSSDKAVYYAMVGEDGKALDILESLLNEGMLEPFSLTASEFKNFSSHPRFIAIRKKMGLPSL
jgi:TolB-like protein/AraC-like DNA-binding protein